MLIVVGSAAAVAGIGLLRRCWAGPVRSRRGNALAWSLLVAGVVLGAAGAGAWGIATVSLAPTVAALLLLGHAAIVTPCGRARTSDRRAHALPEAGEPLRLGARIVTFLLVVPVALAASLVLGVGLRGLAGIAGWREADGNAFAFLAVPLCWALLMVLVTMTERRSGQALILAAPALLGGVALFAGA